jgi:hypothetical protein
MMILKRVWVRELRCSEQTQDFCNWTEQGDRQFDASVLSPIVLVIKGLLTFRLMITLRAIRLNTQKLYALAKEFISMMYVLLIVKWAQEDVETSYNLLNK